MLNFQLARNSGSPEAVANFVPSSIFSLDGRPIEINNAPEAPVLINTRNVDAIVNPEGMSPLAQTFLKIIQTGKIPDDLLPTRQFIDRTGRSINLMSINDGRVYTIQGFGLVKEEEDAIKCGLPDATKTILQDPDPRMKGFARGYTRIQPNGKTDLIISESPLGGVMEESLRVKIENTARAQKILKGFAIVPEWVTNGIYPDLKNDKGNLAWGVYSLPLNLSSFNFAEVCQFLNDSGSRNFLFNEFTFKLFKALRQVHNSGFVHGSPHRGNVMVRFDENGQLMPIIKDWSNMYPINKHGGKYKNPSKDEGMTPVQKALAVDFNKALSSMLGTAIDFGMEQNFPRPHHSLQLQSKKEYLESDRVDMVKSITTAAILGYLLPIDYYPLSYSLASAQEGIGSILLNSEDLISALQEGDFAKYANYVGDALIRAVKPGGYSDEEGFKAFDMIRQFHSGSKPRTFPAAKFKN